MIRKRNLQNMSGLWKKIDSDKIYKISFVLVCFITLLVYGISCYGASIAGDEYFSMGFANNTQDFLFLSKGLVERYNADGWLPGQIMYKYLAVQSGEKFSIIEIYRLVREDVHPPLYFMILNILSSFLQIK